MNPQSAVLVHVASGIGNIVLATPMLAVLARNGFIVDLLVTADYSGVDELFEGWSALRTVYSAVGQEPPIDSYAGIVAAIPPFYWSRYRSRYGKRPVYRPSDLLFYENEQAYYLDFARALGCVINDSPYYHLPRPTIPHRRAKSYALVLAPGSKPLQMATKRWPSFVELATLFEDVALVGTGNDLFNSDGSRMRFPQHVKSFVGKISLRETAALLAGAAVVVANDSGLGHLAGALGAPTILLFGPTPHDTLGSLPPNVRVLRAGLACEPCWFTAPLRSCARRIDCLQAIDVDVVARAVDARKHVRADER